MNFEFEDQVLDFTIPDNYKDIGVMVSGGADSALLLYLLVKQIKDRELDINLHILTSSYAIRGYATQMFANRVVEFVLREFTAHNIIKTNYQFYKDIRRDNDFHQIWNDWWRGKRVDMIVNAVSSMPRDLDAVVDNIRLYDCPDAPIEDGRHAHVHRDTMTYRDITYDTAWHPFTNIDKRFLKYLYDKFELTDTLYSLTYSCENNDADITNNYTTHCNTCWWCLERKWAFG